MSLPSRSSGPVYTPIEAALREFIRTEELDPGARLPSERELAQRLGTSRTSLRQALTALRVEGLIDVRRGDGIYLLRALEDTVPPIAAELSRTHPDLPALGEVRNALEAQGAAWAALRRNDADLGEMITALREMEAQVHGGDAGVPGDRRFHAAVLAAAHNPVLTSLLETISDGALTIATASLARSGQPERSLAAHRIILDAIVARESELAQRLMFQHLDVTGEMLP